MACSVHPDVPGCGWGLPELRDRILACVCYPVERAGSGAQGAKDRGTHLPRTEPGRSPPLQRLPQTRTIFDRPEASLWRHPAPLHEQRLSRGTPGIGRRISPGKKCQVTPLIQSPPPDSPKHTGLTAEEARLRLQTYGRNALEAPRRISAAGLFARQFKDTLILILGIAAAASFLIGEPVDAVAILAIVLLNGILGFVQEWRAEEALGALQKLLTPHARVIRAGREQVIDARELVPGDLIVLEMGERVPADGTLLEANNLHIDESLLTGESLPVTKRPGEASESGQLADRVGEVFMSTIVTNGWAIARVTRIGMTTEVGRIAKLTSTLSDETTPLQRKLNLLGKQLAVLGLGVSALVALIGLLRGQPLVDMFLTGVALAVAVVPEGLPAVVTLTLALGVKTMVRRNALIRRLSAAESLGAATVICTDKTGTLTQNQMTVTRIWTASHEVLVTGTGYTPEGFFQSGEGEVDPLNVPELRLLLSIGLRCNHARLNESDEGWGIVGEPTEGALIVAGLKAGLLQAPVEGFNSMTEFSFNSERKRMTVVFPEDGRSVAYVKGALEVLLPRCTHIQEGDSVRALTSGDRQRVGDQLRLLGEAGLRTLAFAWRLVDRGAALLPDEIENDLTLVGLVGIQDPPRDGVPEAIRRCGSAGIKVIMVTGDAPGTARSIARQIGLRSEGVMTGSQIDDATDEDLLRELTNGGVFARVSPAHKVRVVELLRRQGEVVAMTGDGANDAPALQGADVGIAMGLRGTEVAKAASDMVLTDDNFVSIIGAVEEGRREFSNILKFVRYLLSSNTGEIVAILGAMVIGGPLILLPVQILWMNLITDGVTALALGLEPNEPHSMEEPPRNPRARILTYRAMAAILFLGAMIGGGVLYLFYHGLSRGMDETRARTLAFTAIIVFEKINVFNFRSMTHPLHRIGWFQNPYLIGALLLNISLQVLAVYAPPLQHLLQTAPLPFTDWIMILAMGAPLLLLGELYKMILIRYLRADTSPKAT